MVEDLNKEREENEKVLLEISDKNTKLKNEMSQLHLQLEECLDDRERLQSVVLGFGKCSDEYERALKRITILEVLLQEAHRLINQLESDKLNQTILQNQSLCDELVETSSQLILAGNNHTPHVTTDLIVSKSDSYYSTGIG
ncbi:hypothetical protein O3G_MSEX004654 [Manduca sexta]|uniref:Uncharacterized protein n=1 Tax=Manduca sexta TaxID=7130 RepID=A0A921YX98_MANSE|nr:hypothetical protein O3G_MSEX004654 [Manduca sexta]